MRRRSSKVLCGCRHNLSTKNILQIAKISTDISAVAFLGMVSKATQGNHFPIRIKIFVHNEPPKSVYKK